MNDAELSRRLAEDAIAGRAKSLQDAAEASVSMVARDYDYFEGHVNDPGPRNRSVGDDKTYQVR